MTLGILRYLLYLPLFILATIATYILAPVLVLFAKDGWLPSWCWWFQTWDNSLDGDNGWQFEHRPFLNIFPYRSLSSFQRWVCRFMWLWRNPAYGFAYKLAPNASFTLETKLYEHSVLCIADTGWFFWNGDLPVSETYKFNWLIGWKLPYPDRPSPICCTMRFVKI